METSWQEERIAAFAALADPTRRGLYVFVASQPEGVSRDQAAQAVGISRALAAFHLDRLTAEGLLDAHYRRLSGRTGPGAGRPSKIYRRSAAELSISVPPRNYELLARLLVEAFTTAGARPEVLAGSAGDLGYALGGEAQRRAGPAAGRQDLLQAAWAVLAECGFAPRPDEPDCVVLANCPFGALAAQYRDLVCAANLALINGLIRGLGLPDLSASPDRRDGACCVSLRTAATAT